MLFEDINLFKNALIPKKRIIGLDVGNKKIGIAITDMSRIISNPHSMIIRTNIKKDLEKINDIMKDDYCGFIIGLPILMNGDEGDSCLKIRKFAGFIIERFTFPVYLQDERLSTSAAIRALNETNFTRKKKAALDDKIAASYILQGVLDRMNYINSHF